MLGWNNMPLFIIIHIKRYIFIPHFCVNLLKSYYLFLAKNNLLIKYSEQIQLYYSF